MAINRVHKTKNFTIVSNVINNDVRISNAARGLLHLMLSKPDNWRFTVTNLVNSTKEGRTMVRSELKELQEAGYLEIIKLLPNESPTGRLDYEYHVYEIPKHCIYLENGDVYDTITGKNITMTIPNTAISKESVLCRKLSKTILKYLQKNGKFQGSLTDFIELLPEELKDHERNISRLLKNSETLLLDDYDIVVQRKKTRTNRYIILAFADDEAVELGDELKNQLKTEEEFHETVQIKEQASVAHTRCENQTLYVPQENLRHIQGAKIRHCLSDTEKQTLKTTPLINTNIQSTKKLNTKELKTKRECAINEESSLQQKQTLHKETFLTHSLPLIQQTLVYPDLIQLFEQFILLRHNQGYSVDEQSISYLLSNLQLLATNKNFGNDPYPVAEKYILQMALAKQASSFFNLFDSEWQTIARQPNPYHSPSQTSESVNQPSQASEEMIKQTNQLRDEIMKLCQNGGPKAYVPDYRIKPTNPSSKQ